MADSREDSVLASRHRMAEGRACDCHCGYHLVGTDDTELVQRLRWHLDHDHAPAAVAHTDQEIRHLVGATAYTELLAHA